VARVVYLRMTEAEWRESTTRATSYFLSERDTARTTTSMVSVPLISGLISYP
jgi:hypothetical protein